MIQVLDPGKSLGQSLGESVGKGVTSFSDQLIKGWEKQEKMQKDMFDLKNKLLKERSALQEKVNPTNIKSWLGEAANEVSVEGYGQIRDTALSLLNENPSLGLNDALRYGVEQYMGGPEASPTARSIWEGVDKEKTPKELSKEQGGMVSKGIKLLADRIKEAGPGIAEERRAATKSFPEAMGRTKSDIASLLDRSKEVTAHTRKERQRAYERQKEKGFTGLAKEQGRLVAEPLKGAAEGATFDIAKLPVGKYEDADEQQLANLLHKFGRGAGTFLPYLGAFKAVGLGAKALTGLTGLNGIRAGILYNGIRSGGLGMAGSTFESLAAIGRGEEDATASQKRRGAIGMMAWDAGIRTLGFAKKFNDAVNFISKGTGKSKGTAARFMYDQAKKNGFGFKGFQKPVKPNQRVTLEELTFTPKDAEATQKAITEAVAEAEANPQALAGRLTKEYPGQPAGRVEKVKAKRPMLRPKEAVKAREKQMELYPKLEKEISEIQTKKDAEISKLEAKMTPENKEKWSSIVKPSMDKLKGEYERGNAQVIAVENAIAKAPESQKGRLNTLLKMAERSVSGMEDEMQKYFTMMKYGQKASSGKEMQQAAAKKIEKWKDDIQAGKEIKLKDKDYNPDRIKMAKQHLALSKQKKIPNLLKKYDALFKPHKEYGDIYRRELSKIDDELKKLADEKSLRAVEKARELRKLKDVLKKVIQHADADMVIHNFNMNMRSIEAQKNLRKRMKGLKPVEAGPKVEAVKATRFTKQGINDFNKKAEDFVKDPTKEKAEELLKEQQEKAKGHKKEEEWDWEDVKEEAKKEKSKEQKQKDKQKEQAKSKEQKAKEKAKTTEEQAKQAEEAAKDWKAQFGKFWEKMLGKPGTTSRRFAREFNSFINEMKKKKFYSAMMRTPLGKAIMINAAVIAIEEKTGKRVPYATSLLGTMLAPGVMRFVTAFSRVAYGMVNTARKASVKKEYGQAYRRQDFKKMAELRGKLTPKELKEARKLQRAG